LTLEVIEQSAAPLQAPLQPAKFASVPGVAASRTVVPMANEAAQVDAVGPQSMPAGVEVTAPEPLKVTERSQLAGGADAGEKLAEMAASAASEIAQSPLPEQAPDQPLNTKPAPGAAESTIAVLFAN
jgi:hypothetical protein